MPDYDAVMLRSQGAANAGASSPTRCALLPVRRDRSLMPHDRKPCTSMPFFAGGMTVHVICPNA